MRRFRVGYVGSWLLLFCLAPPAPADTIWAPMWDLRHVPMTWEVRASESTLTVRSFNADFGSFRVQNQAGSVTLATVTGVGDVSTAPLAVVPGDIYRVSVDSGFHYRMSWVGIDWARLGPGLQASGPGPNRGFQSDAELGFDVRWSSLPSRFADTTWSYFTEPGERLSISVEHMTGDPTGAARFEWISPSGVVTVADPDGIPGVGTDHFPARGGNLANPPNPASPYWEEYTAPTDEAGWWGFKLIAKDGPLVPYAWHYVLDRTDAGRDQNHYLRPGALLDPEGPDLPEPASLVAFGSGALILLACVRRRGRAA